MKGWRVMRFFCGLGIRLEVVIVIKVKNILGKYLFRGRVFKFLIFGLIINDIFS